MAKGIKTISIIRYSQNNAFPIGFKFNRDGRGVGMTKGVGYSLLADPVKGCGQRVADLGDDPLPEDARHVGSLFKIGQKGFQSIGKSQIIQHSGSQPIGHGPDVINGIINQGTHFHDPALGLEVNSGKDFFNPYGINSQGGQNLPEMIMKLPCNKGFFSFLGGNDILGQIFQVSLGFFKLGRPLFYVLFQVQRILGQFFLCNLQFFMVMIFFRDINAYGKRADHLLVFISDPITSTQWSETWIMVPSVSIE